MTGETEAGRKVERPVLNIGKWLRGLLRADPDKPEADNTSTEASALAESEIGFDNDAPIDRPERDVFGFDDIAERLSVSVLSMTQREGFVIGIEGPWGSGKSSLTNLLTAKIDRTEGATVIPFAPWIVGSRDELISALMGAFATELDRLQAGSTTSRLKAAGGLADMLRTYGVRAGKGLGPAAQLASLAIPGAGAVAAAIEHGTKLLESMEGGTTPLTTLKAEIAAKLRDLSQRFVVVIDDLDRLEPREVVEVLRLVRAVGDFPNVVYILCYDKKILSESINSALRIEDGDRYLQKIVQASFSVPLPEDTELRHWLYDQSAELYLATTGRPLDKELVQNVSEAVSKAGEMLNTPRDVVQVVNALRLLFPPIASDVHYGDLVWLQIMKVARRDLYDWIERYLTEYSTVAHNDGRVGATNGKRLSKEIDELLPDEDNGNESVWSIWGRLPGISAGPLHEKELRVFNTVRHDQMQAHLAERRLASPVHYRYFFSFTAARNAFSDARLDALIKIAMEVPEELPATLGALLIEERKYGSTWFEHFLRRLIYRGLGDLSDNQVVTLVYETTALADAALRASDDDGASGYDPTWRLCAELFRLGLNRLEGDQASYLINRVVGASPSLGWVLGELIGSELFRHERLRSERAFFESDKVFTEGQLDHAILIAKDRLTQAGALDLLKTTPRLPQVLYRWEAISGSADPIKKWLSQFDADDEGYVDTLLRLRGWAMSDRVYRPLSRKTVDHFLSIEATMARLRSIVQEGGPHAEKASEVIQAIELDKDYS